LKFAIVLSLVLRVGDVFLAVISFLRAGDESTKSKRMAGDGALVCDAGFRGFAAVSNDDLAANPHKNANAGKCAGVRTIPPKAKTILLSRKTFS
jgi:hypothetical protein